MADHPGLGTAQAREQALAANAVVGVRFASAELAPAGAEILVYGTAVKVVAETAPPE